MEQIVEFTLVDAVRAQLARHVQLSLTNPLVDGDGGDAGDLARLGIADVDDVLVAVVRPDHDERRVQVRPLDFRFGIGGRDLLLFPKEVELTIKVAVFLKDRHPSGYSCLRPEEEITSIGRPKEYI